MNRYCIRGMVLVVVFVLLISIGGIVSALHAQFGMRPVQGQAPLSVFFTDISQGNPSDWRWDFGDGSTGEGRQIMHTYLQPGVYTVSMTVSDELGTDTSTLPDSIRVLTNPFFSPFPTGSGIKPSFLADFKVDKRSGSAPLQVRFTDLSMGDPVDWDWDFGDGTSDSGQNPVHVYSKPGSYSVTLSISKEGSTSSKEEKNIISVGEGQAIASMSAGTASKTREEAAGTATSLALTPDFAHGNTSSAGTPPSKIEVQPSLGVTTDEKYPLLNRPRIDFYNQTQNLLTATLPGNTSDLLTVSTSPVTVKAGERFAFTILGKPGEEVYFWVVIPEIVVNLENPAIPYLSSNQSDVVSDHPTGPYDIGAFVPSDEGSTITVRSLIPVDAINQGTASYGQVRLNQTGKISLLWETVSNVPGKYFIRAESKRSDTSSASVRTAAASILVI